MGSLDDYCFFGNPLVEEKENNLLIIATTKCHLKILTRNMLFMLEYSNNDLYKICLRNFLINKNLIENDVY